MMNKIEAEKELISVINDLTNPYNEHKTEVEACLLAEDGWRKVAQAEWVDAGFDDYYKCSNCGYIHCTAQQLRVDPEHYLYCGHCGAEMRKGR